MKRQYKILSLFVVMTAAITACQPNQNKVRGNVGAPAAILTNGNLNTLSTTCAGQATGSVLGAITSTMGASAFQSQVVALLSATMTSDQVGTVSPIVGDSTGIRFKGTVALDASGNVVSSRSYVKISIYDSIWLSNQTEENSIPLEFNPNNGASITGSFNSSGVGYFIVKDNYGSIRFDGTVIAGGNFSGTVSFSNTTSVSGAAQSGTLGQFTITTCGMIQK